MLLHFVEKKLKVLKCNACHCLMELNLKVYPQNILGFPLGCHL